ncbi:hypothetical protein [Actinacidiphila sp. ITFR-21]|uniref:hypothetical protein n=1 Tax=Actinacidiphila sp. ITFR-21 TaxID=3075199 RepID=UPI00288A45BF|nr:hypothetical protein [Streptomyces sp. ITFR-21]WNI17109.1 hypothetical protein RLT57_17350 [Streptomyces sp. ITFR-21]
MSRQESPTQSTGAHRRHRAPGGRERGAREGGRDAAREPAGGTAGRGGSEPVDGAGGDAAAGTDAVSAAGTGTGTGSAASRGGGPDKERGAHGRGRRPRGPLPMQPPAHYEPYLDGLFTYCLSLLCEHTAATAAVGEVLALAERQRTRLREPSLRRPWLYALARWACLRRLAAVPGAVPLGADPEAERRRAQLAALAWPEAAGTTPEQREALELAVRHQLSPREVAHVLGLDTETARALLARAACAVERTRTALAVVDTGCCPAVARRAADAGASLGTVLRGELVRHVDDCAVCRRTAERVVAAGPWPGAPGAAGFPEPAGSTGVLVLIELSRPAAYAALLRAMDAGLGRSRDATPRFDRRGFPLDLQDRAARRTQLRHRAVTSTVVAAVVAAPVLALWAAYQAAPLGEGHGTDRAASERDGLDGVPYEKAGSSRPAAGSASSGASAAAGTPAVAVSSPSAAPPADGSGYLTVTAHAGHRHTLVTLTASGGTPVRWGAVTAAYWLRLSDRGGTLRPGESVTVAIGIDRSLEPSGPWTARISFTPGRAGVVLRGSAARPVPPPGSTAPTPPESGPAASPAAPPPTPPAATPPPDSPSPAAPASPPPTPAPSATPAPTAS